MPRGPTTGEELGVETLLSGTVQRIGDRVRVNLQLIDADTDRYLWADTYERELTVQNIFSIQSDISEAVAAALRVTLSPAEQVRVASMPTTDLRAYRLYKEARSNLYQRRLETLREAREQFREAIALDREYAEAHAGLAESTMLLWINHNDIAQEVAIEATQSSLEQALALDPGLADAYAIRGLLESTLWSHAMVGNGNVEAEGSFRRAIALNPNHASAYMWFASLRNSEDRLDEAIELYQRSMELDPLARIPYSNLPQIYSKKGQHEQAMALWLEAVRIHSDWPTLYQYIAVELWGLGRFDEAYAWNDRYRALTRVPSLDDDLKLAVFVDLERARLYALRTDPLLAGDSTNRINRQTVRNAVKLAYIEQRRGQERAANEMQALAVVRDLPRLGTYGHGIRDVQIYALLGRKEDALGAFREALDEGFRGSLMFDGWPLYADPYLDNLRGDPRFASMIDELDGYLAIMRDRLLQAEATDDLDSLRAMATRI